MSIVNPREVITSSLGHMVDFGRTYARDLPEDLARWHCYTLDGGHSILVALDDGKLSDAPTREQLEGQLVPAPVKAVERAGWRVVDGFVVCKLPSDPNLGLVTEPGDDEYGDGPETNGAPAAGKPLTKYAVGEPYPGKAQWIDGTVEIRVLRQGVDFVLAVSNPAGHEVRAFRQGNAEFALAPGDHHLMWAYKFTDPSSSTPRNSIAWSDQPWEYHRQAAAGPVEVPGPRGASFPLQLVLVDAATGIIKALRLIGPPVEFADAVRDAVVAQATLPYNAAAADREIQQLYQRFPTTRDLVVATEIRFEALRDSTTR